MEKLIKQNLKFYSKFLLFIGAMIAFVCSFGVSSYAWTEDSDGNLVSDNIYNIGDYSGFINGVSMEVTNQTLTLNGTSTSGSWNNRTDLSITLDAGTYTMQWFTNYQYNNIGFGLRSSGTGLTELYQLNSQRYRTFTISDTTTFTTIIWWQTNNMTFDNVVVSCMVYSGNYKSYNSFEPYGKIYYSNDVYEPVSQLFYGNLSKAYLSYTNSSNNIYSMGFVYNGRFGTCDTLGSVLPWSDFNYQYAITMDYVSNISTSYGLFYNTNWSLYDFIQEVSDYPSILPDKPLKIVYEFITLQDFDNTYFSMSGFPNVNFYDINGALLGSYMGNSFNVTLYGVNSIELIESSGDDVADDNYYLITDFYNGYYLQGYQNGYSAGISLNDVYYQNGYSYGYQTGMNDYMNGVYSDSNSYIYGYDAGYDAAAGSSYASGYAAGYAKARADTTWIDNSTANASDLFWTIGSTPWETFKNIWNVNFLGINIANVITGFVTALIIIWLIKKVWK